MRVNSPLVGVYGPSLFCMHWDFCEPPGGFTVPQLYAPSDHCVCSLNNPVLVKHYFFLICP